MTDLSKLPWHWRCQRCSHYMTKNRRACPRCDYTVFDPITNPGPTLSTDEVEPKTMIQLGPNAVMELPEPEFRKAYTVGEHRLVKAWPEDESDPEIWDWMCFDHGWRCWMTKAAQNAPVSERPTERVETGEFL